MTRLSLDRPWLTLDLGRKMQVLSWAINRPGLTHTRRIVWREVSNTSLSEGLDVRDWFKQTLQSRGIGDAVGFLTSRDIGTFSKQSIRIGATHACAVATVGLSNAERIGTRRPRHGGDPTRRFGTINIAVYLNRGLSETALLEAISIAAQARTVAVMDLDLMLPTGRATGTGTDCIAVAAPAGSTEFAGLHTETGEAIGRAVHDAVWQGARNWALAVAKQGQHRHDDNRRADNDICGGSEH